jgi:hypothetical protein
MSRELARTVVRRWKKSSESLDLSEDIADILKDDGKALRGDIARCKYLVPIYQSLVSPLMSPQIGEVASRALQRGADLEALQALLQSASRLIQKVTREWNEAVELRAQGGKVRGWVETVLDLPSVMALQQLNKEAIALQQKVTQEDERSWIDWSLDDYIGFESGIYGRIEKARPADLDLSGPVAVEEFVDRLTDADNFDEAMELRGA